MRKISSWSARFRFCVLWGRVLHMHSFRHPHRKKSLVRWWDLRYSVVLRSVESFTDVSGRVDPIFKGQEGSTRCPETSLKDYHSTLRNTPEDRRSHQYRGRSLKSRMIPWCPANVVNHVDCSVCSPLYTFFCQFAERNYIKQQRLINQSLGIHRIKKKTMLNNSTPSFNSE